MFNAELGTSTSPSSDAYGKSSALQPSFLALEGPSLVALEQVYAL